MISFVFSDLYFSAISSIFLLLRDVMFAEAALIAKYIVGRLKRTELNRSFWKIELEHLKLSVLEYFWDNLAKGEVSTALTNSKIHFMKEKKWAKAFLNGILL